MLKKVGAVTTAQAQEEARTDRRRQQQKQAATLKAIAEGVETLARYLTPMHSADHDMEDDDILAIEGEVPRCRLVREMVSAVGELLEQQP